jgi:two-component system, LytTR family, sensor kinase
MNLHLPSLKLRDANRRINGPSILSELAKAEDSRNTIGRHLSPAFRPSHSKRLTRTRVALLIFLGWTAVGLFETLPEMASHLPLYEPVPWYAVAGRMLEAWVWALFTPVLLMIDRKIHSKPRNIGLVIGIFAALSVPFVLVHTYLTGIILYPVPEIWWSPLRRPDYAVYYNIGGWVTYCGTVAILEAVRFYNSFLVSQLQLERVKGSLLEARLNALRLHLEPHFLSNALNAISSEVEARPRQARQMIANLGILLRRSLDTKDGPEISLAAELRLLEHYLAIQRIRFGDRIDIKIQVESAALAAAVPSMLLQPLVENAIRHGVEKRRSGGNIVVSASIAGDRLNLSVVDDGRGLPRSWNQETSTGHGLRITRERLFALYPDFEDECLLIERCPQGGTRVTICIPLHTAEHDSTIA